MPSVAAANAVRDSFMLSKLFALFAVALFLYRLIARAKPLVRSMGSSSTPRKPAKRSAYEILDVQPGADQETIRRAYQKKIQEYHPDRLHTAADELQTLAEKRMKEINQAYEQLSQREK
jgi:DnaJ-domain-containing protein 1